MLPIASTLSLIALLCHVSDAQQCPENGLQSPPTVQHNSSRPGDIEWEAVPGLNNTWRYTLIFDAETKEWPDLNTRVVTRLFNGYMPSQTLRFKRGNQYRITVQNNLGPESADNPTGFNVEKDVNTTNIHTHGLHISGHGDSDNVFIAIGPGESRTYRFNIPCNHAGGTFWWHPHHHGSTHLQVGGGAAGALIVEDDAESEGLPTWYSEMRELIFYITHIHLSKYTTMLPDFDDTWKYEKYDPSQRSVVVDTFWVNGEFQPTICMEAGEWIKFRFGQVETTEKSRTYYIGDGECTQYLLARDGVMVHGMDDQSIPRLVGNAVFLAHSSRADVAISCPGHPSGSITYEIWHNLTSTTLSGVQSTSKYVIAYIEVTGTVTEPQLELTSFTPIRPDYLQNLMPGKYTGNWEYQQYSMCSENHGDPICEEYHYLPNVEVSGATIYQQKFDGESNYFASMDAQKVHVWEITNEGVNLHPLHIHVNHFQMINSTLNLYDPADYDNWVEIPDGYQEEGDWLDTLWGPGFITFKTDVWGGTVAIHCHILIHEDQGAMATVWINGGCDGDYGDIGGIGPSCHYTDSCEQFGPLEPSSYPTAATPSQFAPTASPSMEPTGNENTASITILMLTLKGSLSNFELDADQYCNGSVENYAAAVVRWAMGGDENSTDIAIQITLVERGSVEITYSLTSTSLELLVVAVSNIALQVANEAKFQYTTDSKKWKLIDHQVLVDYTLVTDYYFNPADGWNTKEIILLVVVVVMLFLCCAVLFYCFKSYQKRRVRDEIVRNLRARMDGHPPAVSAEEVRVHDDAAGIAVSEHEVRGEHDVIAVMDMIEVMEIDEADIDSITTAAAHIAPLSRSKSLKSLSFGTKGYMSPEKAHPDTVDNTDSDDDDDIKIYAESSNDERQESGHDKQAAEVHSPTNMDQYCDL